MRFIKPFIAAIFAAFAIACSCHESDAPFSGIFCNGSREHASPSATPTPSPCAEHNHDCDDGDHNG